MRREIVDLVNAGSSPCRSPLFRDGVTGNTPVPEIGEWRFEASSRSQFFEVRRLGVTGSTLARLASSPGSNPGAGTVGTHRAYWGRGREAKALDCRSRLREFESRRSRLNLECWRGRAERGAALLKQTTRVRILPPALDAYWRTNSLTSPIPGGPAGPSATITVNPGRKPVRKSCRMDIALLKTRFAKIGARARVREPFWINRYRPEPDLFAIDIAFDAHGEYFDFRVPRGEDVDLMVVDVQPAMRHLFLLVRQDGRKDKFLCGHDERHWFVAGVPGQSASTVITAIEALKPQVVRGAQSRKALDVRERLRRRNAAFVRQGEWFFIPTPELIVSKFAILRNEPISRGGGSKPHMCEQVFRRGGLTVYVNGRYPNGLTEDQYRDLLDREPAAFDWGWQRRNRNAEVYARGRVWHSDHQTVRLADWHRVLMNTESQAPAMKHLVFLD